MVRTPTVTLSFTPADGGDVQRTGARALLDVATVSVSSESGSESGAVIHVWMAADQPGWSFDTVVLETSNAARPEVRIPVRALVMTPEIPSARDAGRGRQMR